MLIPGLRNAPMLTFGATLGSGKIADPRKYPKARVLRLPLKEIFVHKVDPITIDGLDSYEILASAVNGKLPQENSIYQVMLFDQDNYWLGVGIASTEHQTEYFPIFRRAIASFQRD
ncbi:MAG: hypothetical protein ACI8PQ_001627 [Planctomycetota bacterium]